MYVLYVVIHITPVMPEPGHVLANLLSLGVDIGSQICSSMGDSYQASHMVLNINLGIGVRTSFTFFAELY